jgi:predicted ester cyclase
MPLADNSAACFQIEHEPSRPPATHRRISQSLEHSQQETERPCERASIDFRQSKRTRFAFRSQPLKEFTMTKEQDNKAIVGRWFTDFWGKTCNLGIVDELAAPNMLLQYSLHAPRRGRDDIKSFMSDFRRAFPDLNFWGAADLIAEGDYVVGRWEGGGTHTGPAFSDFLVGSLPAATGLKMRFTGTTVLRLEKGKIVEEIGLDDGVTALQQLGLLKAA